MTSTIVVSTAATAEVLDEVDWERIIQHAKWGEQDWPDAESTFKYWMGGASYYRDITEARAKSGSLTYLDILLEEVAEAADEAKAGDKVALKAELIQVAAVAVAWVEKLNREAAQQKEDA